MFLGIKGDSDNRYKFIRFARSNETVIMVNLSQNQEALLYAHDIASKQTLYRSRLVSLPHFWENRYGAGKV